MTTLISKIAAASLKVGSLETDKTNTQQNYKYISADKILERAGDALAKAGIVIVPSITVENTEAVKTDKGGTRYDSVVHFAMVITDGETQLEMPWIGRGNDYSVPDKALYKAITSGHKYFLMKLLNVGVGNEDGEHESSEDAQVTPARAKPPASPSHLEAMEVLGVEYHGADAWEEARATWVSSASKGAKSSSKELVAKEVDWIISSLQKRINARAIEMSR